MRHLGACWPTRDDQAAEYKWNLQDSDALPRIFLVQALVHGTVEKLSIIARGFAQSTISWTVVLLHIKMFRAARATNF